MKKTKQFWLYKNYLTNEIYIAYKIKKSTQEATHRCKAELYMRSPSENILKIISKVEKTVNKKQLIKSSSNVLLNISGGQDSSFLLFCFSFLQTQIAFKFKIIWYNHFWQSSSFYTTLHLTKCAVAFSSPIVGFLPFQISSSPLFYKNVTTRYKTNGSLQLSASVRAYLHMEVQNLASKAFLTKKKLRIQVRTNFLTSTNLSPITSGERQGLSPFTEVALTNRRFVRATPYKSLICTKGERQSRQDKVILPHTNLQFVRATFTYKFSYKSLPLQIKDLYAAKTRFVSRFVLVCEALQEEPYARRFVSPIAKLCIQIVNLYASHPITTKPKGYKKFVEEISEVRARNWRHITTERACTFYASSRCVYGHTLSDRVETILFNLIRGAGSKGVQPLQWKRRHSNFCYNSFYPSLEQIMTSTHINTV